MKTNAGTVLLYNCSGPEFFKLQQIFAMLRLRMRPVGPEKYGVPIGLLAKGEGESAGTAGEPIPESMLVFCGLNRALLDQVLQVLRAAKLPPIPLKAVMTPDNQEWDTLQLYGELKKEREAVEAAQKPQG